MTELIHSMSWTQIAAALGALGVGGSFVPWGKLRALLPRRAAAAPQAPSKDTKSNGAVADAIYTLRVNAPNPEFQVLVTAVDDAYWKAQTK